MNLIHLWHEISILQAKLCTYMYCMCSCLYSHRNSIVPNCGPKVDIPHSSLCDSWVGPNFLQSSLLIMPLTKGAGREGGGGRRSMQADPLRCRCCRHRRRRRYLNGNAAHAKRNGLLFFLLFLLHCHCRHNLKANLSVTEA